MPRNWRGKPVPMEGKDPIERRKGKERRAEADEREEEREDKKEGKPRDRH